MAQKVDVFVCGGGPVGLLLSYQLARLGLSTYVVEQFDKTEQAMYGRASTLYPRTLEMLDQLDLMDTMSQVGFVGRGSSTFKNGERVHGRGWNFISHMYDTHFDYCLNIRQKYSENIFRDQYESLGGKVHAGAKLLDYRVDESASDYKVIVQVQDEQGKKQEVAAKYIIGADGGRSSVRHIAGIPFPGDRTALHWIRVDAVIETSMPDARVGFGSVESPTHGNVLWVALDHGRTRIGFALNKELYAKYGDDLTEEIVKKEAQNAMAPFSLKFIKVDWWTLYSIGQRVAERFQDKERVLLAGDAGHTHSSGAAQGMNTGMHDAVNLGWKIAGVVKGYYKPSVLATYSPERRSNAQHLINLDKNIASLISGTMPQDYAGAATEPDVALNDLLESSAQFTTGLGVHYEEDGLLNKHTNIAAIMPGWRAPDALVRKPATALPVRINELMKNHAQMWILVFAGSPMVTREAIKTFRKYIDSDDSFTRRLNPKAYKFLTIIAEAGLQPDETLGVEKFGNACYDVDHSCHARYGVTPSQGGVLVVRPDGIFSFAAALEDGAELGKYLDQVIEPANERQEIAKEKTHSETGEIELNDSPQEKRAAVSSASARRPSIY